MKFLNIDIFLSLKIVFILANSADPDEMLPYATLMYIKISIQLIKEQINNGTFLHTFITLIYAVKPVSSSHSKIDKAKILKVNGSLMKVKSIAECSFGAFCNTFCNTFDLHVAIIGLENQFLVVLKAGFTVY